MTNERDDHIRRRAHEIWEREGRPHGRHDDHWAQAAREIEGGGGTTSRASTATPRARKAADGTVPARRPKPAAEGVDAAAATPRRRAAKPAAEAAANPPRAPRKSAKSAPTES